MKQDSGGIRVIGELNELDEVRQRKAKSIGYIEVPKTRDKVINSDSTILL
jgi:hypothetical protein